jgi:hypothetical protein
MKFASEVRSLLVLLNRLAGAFGAGRRSIGPPGGSSITCVRPPGAVLARIPRSVLLLAGVVLAVGLALLLGAVDDADAAVTAPHNIIAFPQRDYVSASGYTVGIPATVEVIHAGAVLPASTATDVVPVEDPATPGSAPSTSITPVAPAGRA